MNELIKVNYGTEHPTVSARDLHEGLEITDRFSRWFERMTAYGFESEKDFTSVKSSTLVNNGAEREILDYEISVDMAKQICMLQRSEKGRQYRQYFLDLEKAWNTPEQVMARALKMAGKTIDNLKDRCKFLGGQVVEQQKLIEEMIPKANYVDHILESKSLVATTQIAKDYGMSAIRFNQILNSLKIQYKDELKYKKDTVRSTEVTDMPTSHGNGDATANLAVRRAELQRKCELIEQTAIEADPDIYQYIIKGVTTEYATYRYLREIAGMPCGKNMYYDRRRKFFFLLSKKM